MKMNGIVFVLMMMVMSIECFEEKLIEKSFEEEQENGTIVLDLREEISSLSKEEKDEGYEMRFVRRCFYFYFDGENSFLIRSLRIDREEICSNEEKCFLTCELLMKKEEKIRLIKLKIEIKDKNDHRPTFLKKNSFYEISKENLRRSSNFSIELEKAQDKDFHFHHFYFLNSSTIDFPFELKDRKDKDFLELFIDLQKIKRNEYEFQLIVVDEDEQRDSSLVRIQFIEDSFHLFQFQSDLYQFTIRQSNQTFLGQISLQNSSFDDRMNYRLIFSNQFDSNLFFIDQTNGKIFLKDFHQIQQNSFYQFFAEAAFTNQISTLTTIQIFLNFTSSPEIEENRNDFIEILIPKSFQKNSQILIKENNSIPLTILQLFVSSSSSLSFESSIDSNSFLLKQFDEHSYEFILLQSIDYELIQLIHLNFTLQHSFVSKSLLIHIENINDCPPHLSQSNFSFQIHENNPSPLLLHTFQPFDQDSSNNFTFSLVDVDQNLFSINSTTGELFLLQSFDREYRSNYSFSICISDQIFQSCSSLLLLIEDQNDFICSFNSSSINISIDENLPPNYFIYQFIAQDLDSGPNGELFYSFNSSTPFLNINSSTGQIQTTSKSFDYELIQSYSIVVTACDNIHSSPSFCCSFQLHFNINDLNDHFPFLVFPSNIHQIFFIDYSNQSMPQIKAIDQDLSPKHRQIFFTIIGGSLNSSLSIHRSSGQLSLRHNYSSLPLFGTLIISLSKQTIVHLTVLIHRNQTEAFLFLRSLEQQQQSYSFYLISFPILLLFIISFFLFFFLSKHRSKCDDHVLINTPSTTTLSNRSISTTNNKKLYQTYYSFGDSFISPQIIHV